MFVYGLKLGFDLKAETSTVSQIDLVPTLSLLLGKLVTSISCYDFMISQFLVFIMHGPKEKQVYNYLI